MHPQTTKRFGPATCLLEGAACMIAEFIYSNYILEAQLIILHASELDGMLAVWGEASDRTNGNARRAKTARRTHPFSATFDDLRDVLKKQLNDAAVSYRERQATAWLPTKADSPIPSSIIVAEPIKSKARTKIAPWEITACQFRGPDAVKVLRHTMGKRTLAPGVIVGDSLSYWSDALRFAGSIVARQQFIPDLAARQDSFYAVWSPVFAGKDAERLAVLAKLMLPACRALSGPEAKSAPKTLAADALVPVITSLVDGMARTWVLPGRNPSNVMARFDSIHDAWLHALMSRDGEVDKESGDIEKFSAHVGEWQRPVAISSESSFRFCFKLVEPAESDRSNTWHMLYLVHPRNDPSLLVPANDLWKGKVKIPGTDTSRSKEFLLLSLGQASELSGRVAAGLESGGMSGFDMSLSEAYKFLKEDAAALEQAGYGIMLPSWWTGSKPRTKISVRANIKSAMKGGGGMSLDTIVQFDWQAAVGDKNITLKELERLAKLKEPLVNIRGQWIDASSQDIQSAIDLLKGSKKTTMRDALMLKVREGGNASDALDVSITSSTKTIAEVLDGVDSKEMLKSLGQPDGFVGKLRPYQERGYSWLSFLQKWGFGGCLADDMGLGKTIQMLALIQQYVKNGGSKPVLLVCPMSLIENWRKEAAKFVPELAVMTHHGSKRATDSAFKKEANKHALVISSYGLMYRDMSFIKKVGWAGVVLDEAQNVKNHDTKQAKAVRSFDAGFRFAMTGTPVENNVGDLWSIMDFLNPDLLGTQQEFVREYFVPIQIDRDSRAAERLKRTTGPFVLRRLKTDKSIISDLPKKMELKVYCQLTKEQASLYSSVLNEMEKALYSAEGIRRKGVILGALSRLKQVCNHPAQFLKDGSSITGRSGKLARLTAMLEEAIGAGDKILIFTQFAEMGAIIQKHIHETFGVEAPFLHGGVSRTRRAQMIESFQDSGGGGPQVFVLSLKAGGTGLNLTAANRVIHFDRWWNPAVEDQATDRAFRIGQTRNVHVHKFVCAGTLEEKIDEMIERKKQITKQVVGAGEGWITEMSNSDLRDVLSLRSGAAVM